MKIIKKYYKYSIFFIIIFFSLIFFGYNNIDNMWNYGMAHAIRIGEIPYKDFNIISTPLYPFIMSIGLFIKDSYLVYIIEQSILCTIVIFFVEKILKDKYLLVFPFIISPLIYFLLPNYNFFFFLLLVITLYLEKEKKDDSIIGIMLGFLFLTKHTMGCFIILFSLLSTHNFKKIGKRTLFLLIPISLFMIYLLITKSLYNFIDLSILGLFDFGSKNTYTFIPWIILVLGLLIYCIYSVFKDKNNIFNYYLLGSFSFIIPILDTGHLYYLLLFFLIVKIIDISYDNKLFMRLYSIILTVLIIFLNIYSAYPKIFNLKTNIGDKIKYILVDESRKNYNKKVLEKYNQYDNSYMICMESILFDIESNHKINYFDIPLYGNFGYKGSDKMINKINNMHDVYFFVRNSNNRQFANELVDTVRKRGKFISIVDGMEIYYLE